ncbi:hypothetical protein DKL61_02730 [Gammaproteobacteria bacterium ESL0073]|nr:hypothetical protein DKL61_02730 [Gammaproteobacteria bacterium ESL0073]
MDLSGNNLDNTLFFEADVQDTIILYGLDSRFKFSIDGCDGECIISLGYQSYNNDKAALEANIKKIKFDQKNITDRKKKEVSLSILRGTSYDRLDRYKNIFERKG